MDPLEIKPASIPVIAGMVGDVREVVGKSGSTEKEEYGQKDGHKEEQDTRMEEECKGDWSEVEKLGPYRDPGSVYRGQVKLTCRIRAGVSRTSARHPQYSGGRRATDRNLPAS